MNFIYGYYNKITKKWYVGQTTLPVQERHRLHLVGATHEKASDYNCLFHKKIREYGIENFDLVVLEEVALKEDLDEKEIYWIKEKHSFVKDNGYNLTTGGQQRKNNENYIDIRQKFQNKEELLKVISQIKDINNSMANIANEYQVSLSLICMINTGKKYFQENEKYPLRPLKTKINQEMVQNIIALLQQNYSNKEIAEIFQIDPDVVYRINYGKAHKQKELSYPIRKEMSKNEQRSLEIKKLLQEGKLNNKEIAQIVKCDPSVVSNINYGKAYFDKELNYPLRPNKN